MTRIVVMDEELHESITVVDIPSSFMRAVEAGHHPPFINLPIHRQVAAYVEEPPEQPICDVVRLRLERVTRDRDPKPIFWYAYASDPTLALELRSAFLPGQLGEVKRREREAFWRGAFAALR